MSCSGKKSRGRDVFRGVCCAGLFLLDFLGIAGKSIRLKIPSKKTIGMS
jgi:hypothetical protein